MEHFALVALDLRCTIEGSPSIPSHTPSLSLSLSPPLLDRDMLPMMNVYDLWTATPGMTGEPLDSFTLLLNFEGMGAQVCSFASFLVVFYFGWLHSTK